MVAVSIHAPTRGATNSAVPKATLMYVSIHAPTRGATSTEITFRALSRVSIHAPTRGATQSAKTSYCQICCFNPRTHTGCDLSRRYDNAKQGVSIHAPTRGATFYISMCLTFYICFNPRTHTGCDLVLFGVKLVTLLFQSTHPHGVRHHTQRDFIRYN